MENAADALKIAFSVFIFVFALSLAFSTITQAKNTADIVLFTNDKTNYYQLDEVTDPNAKGRIVGIDTVISTIYRCKNETMVVKIIEGANITTFDSAQDKGELNSNISNFIKNNVTNDSTYLEQFVEAKYSGKEITADDGSTIIETRGASKMYITYTKQS